MDFSATILDNKDNLRLPYSLKEARTLDFGFQLIKVAFGKVSFKPKSVFSGISNCYLDISLK